MYVCKATLGTLPLTVPSAVILLDFDPLFRAGDASVRISTLVLAAVVAGALLLAARIAATTPAYGPNTGPFAHPHHLRLDDLLFIVLGVVPGAVIGGRVEYVLTHLDYYLATTGAIVDPGQGGMGLGLAVVGGIASGAFVTRLLEAPTGRWAHVAALPTLLALAGGRVAQVLSGDGQGQPTDLSWATSYVGPGPWGSLAPSLPSHPAQAYEAVLVAVVLVVLGGMVAGGAFARRDGRALALAIGLWAVVRVVVAVTWRDEPVSGGLNAAQVIAVAIAGGCAVVLVAGRSIADRVERRSAARHGAGDTQEPDWPDPASRPRF